jgi:hydroxyacylglutathione hydrolase
VSLSNWTTKNGYEIVCVMSGRSNVFLVTDGRLNILVDTSPRFMRGRLVRNLEKAGIHKIDLLILTHTHFDHAGNAAYIQKKFKARVVVHREEQSYIESGINPMIRGTNRFSTLIAWLAQRKRGPVSTYEPCLPDILVDERLDLPEYGIIAYLLYTPGHTPGSISLIVDDEIAIVGDAMVGMFRGSIFPPFAIDEKLLVGSWGKLLQTRCRWFLPSHGSANSRELVERSFTKKQASLKPNTK